MANTALIHIARVVQDYVCGTGSLDCVKSFYLGFIKSHRAGERVDAISTLDIF